MTIIVLIIAAIIVFSQLKHARQQMQRMQRQLEALERQVNDLTATQSTAIMQAVPATQSVAATQTQIVPRESSALVQDEIIAESASEEVADSAETLPDVDAILASLALAAEPPEGGEIEASSSEEPSIEEASIDTLPIEEPSIEKLPIDTSPIEQASSDTPSVDASPIEEPPIEKLPVDTSPIEQPSSDVPPIDTAPIDNLPIEKSPSRFEQALAYAKNWITTGNIPVKIGMLVLFSAVIAFLRYAANMGWFTFPMQYRLIGVAVAALGALGFAWTKRNSKRSFSLSVQGGSIGILLLVIFSAVKMYGFISPTAGFALSVLMVLLAAVLALQQDAKALIIMAIFAGFLAPIWLSTGMGNHVVLFTYYAILNIGIFIVAWQKPWRELNLLGFVFTYVIGSTWGGLRYTEANFATTEPFVALFFLFYLLIPLRYAQRLSAGDRRYVNKIDSALLFGTPLVTLGLEVGMLHNRSDWLALSCVAIGLVYAALALILRGRDAYAALRQAYIGLSASFLTLAVPIGLSARSTATIFALEGAGAVWFGARERRLLTWVSGTLLQLAAAVAFAIAFQGVHHLSAASKSLPLFINDYALSALLLVISAGVCVGACHYFARRGWPSSDGVSTFNAGLTQARLASVAKVLFLWGVGWWLYTAGREVQRVSSDKYDLFLLAILTAGVLLLVFKYYTKRIVTWVQSWLLLTSVGVVVATLVGVCLDYWQISSENLLIFYPLTAWHAVVWGIFALIGWLVWKVSCEIESAMLDIAVFAWLLSLATMISIGIYQCLPRDAFDTGWYWWAITAVWLALAALICLRPQWLEYFAKRPTRAWQSAVANTIVWLITAAFIWVAHLSGGSGGLWLPIANSVDLLALTMAGLILLWVLRYQNGVVTLLAYSASIVFIVSVTLRMMHHWGGFSAWNPQLDNLSWDDKHWFTVFGFWLVIGWCIVLTWMKKANRLAEVWLPVLRVFMECVLLLLLCAWGMFIFRGGEVFVLPWLPILNMADLLQVLIVVLVLTWMLYKTPENDRNGVLTFAYCLIVPTVLLITLRMMHHWGGYSLWVPAEYYHWNDWLTLATFGFWLVIYGLSHGVQRRQPECLAAWQGIIRALQASITALLFVAWFVLLGEGGNSSPLPWLPVLNPLTALQWGIFAMMWQWFTRNQDDLPLPRREMVMPALALLLISVMTLRFVHHYAAVPWSSQMFSLAVTQMALTLVWSVLGVVAWILGSRRASRPVWVLGALLMGVVLVKLVFIDRGHLGNLFGIASFFAYGVLCVIVGYFAPMPPARSSEAA